MLPTSQPRRRLLNVQLHYAMISIDRGYGTVDLCVSYVYVAVCELCISERTLSPFENLTHLFSDEAS